MDVAIRATNWCLAVHLFAGAGLESTFWAEMLADLRIAGEWVEHHLEWHPVYRGNHYVANLVGLAYLGTLFRGTRHGQRWLRLGSRGLQREIEYQICDDGVAFEGSLAYHRLHTELFGWAGELLRLNDPSFDAARFDAVLGRMSAFIGAYLQPDGRAPMIGDADDGRLHALSARAMSEPRRHAEGLPERYSTTIPADGAFSFPAGGFHVLRWGGEHAVIRCGPVGLKGAGSHDHNDQLGFELVTGGQRLISDAGTYAYTRDLAARYAFRSVAAHSVVQLGEEEPNPIVAHQPWRVLADRTRSQVLACEAGPGTLVFGGEHFGYSHRASGAVCRRTLALDTTTGVWQLEDDVLGTGHEALTWRLHLAVEEVVLKSSGGRVMADCTCGGQRFRVELEIPAGLQCRVESQPASEAYGVARPRAVLLASGTVRLPAHIECRIRKLETEER